MSRIIVKGLPKAIKEDRLKDTFGVMGTITNCQLKDTKEGIFRRFAFLGFTKESEAEAAIQHFNHTYIDASKITVELASELTDPSKPRAWSRYSKDSSAYQKANQELIKEKKENEKKERMKKRKEEKEKRKEEKLNELMADIQGDEGFHEFLEVNKAKTNKAFWGNDDVAASAHQEKKGNKEGGIEEEEEEEEDEKMEEEVEEEQPSTSNVEHAAIDKKAAKMSDLEYLKSKMTSCSMLSDSDESESEAEKEVKKKMEEDEDESGKEEEKDVVEKSGDEFRYFLKMKGAPNTVKRKQIEEFFRPIKLVDVKIPNIRNKKSKIVTVELSSEEDVEKGLKRNKNCIGPKRVFLHKVVERKKPQEAQQKPKLWEMKMENEECEDIGESGRLYLRNLAYCCTEDELERLFTKYGPVSEVHLPIDSFTKKVKGFAFVTFMFPEHAVKAFQDLDGKAYMGRLLHILPGQEKKEEQHDDAEGEKNYKKKKLKEQKASASSSHNWNTLFLGVNAVVDTMAEQFDAKKSDILGVDGTKESIGVRVALGETKVVSETRSFLLDNGVSLDSFSQPASARSKTVILAKNLPANTTAEELREKFEKFGTLGRLLLPPSRLSAIIEFSEPTEARTAFRS